MAHHQARCRGFCITVNNPLPEDEEAFNKFDSVYSVYQYEKGESGTIHLQGYLRFANAVALSTIKAGLSRAHIELAKGNDYQNKLYCTKEEGRVDGPWEYGTMAKPGKRTDLIVGCEAIDMGASVNELIVDNPNLLRSEAYLRRYKVLKYCKRDRNVGINIYVYIGPPGSGKTKKIYDDYKDSVYSAPVPTSQIWFDGYEGQKVIMLDEWPLVERSDLYEHLLKITDRYPYDVPIKGGFVPLGQSDIIISSNDMPGLWFQGRGLRALGRRVKEFWKFSLPFPSAPVQFFPLAPPRPLSPVVAEVAPVAPIFRARPYVVASREAAALLANRNASLVDEHDEERKHGEVDADL